MPALGGRLRLLGYSNQNAIDAAASASQPTVGRNLFRWKSRSFGAEWQRTFSQTNLRLQGWSAEGSAGSAWNAQIGPVELSNHRRDLGFLAEVEKPRVGGTSLLGLRSGAEPNLLSTANRIRISRSIVPAPRRRSSPSSEKSRLASARGQCSRSAPRWPLPRAAPGWDPGPKFAGLRFPVSRSPAATFARTSLPNRCATPSRSSATFSRLTCIVGAGIPRRSSGAERSGRPGVGLSPCTRSQTRRSGIREEGNGIAAGCPERRRALHDRELHRWIGRIARPFGRRGSHLIAVWRRRQLRVAASAPQLQAARATSPISQRLTNCKAESPFLPTHSLSLRLGGTALFGRRTTTIASGFEWEACNLTDRGCEFAGSPYYGGESLGAVKLPAYLQGGFQRPATLVIHDGRTPDGDGRLRHLHQSPRADQRAHLRADPANGRPVAVEMRPRSPLVLGLDWRF
jgi:hypothetical protein